jgi:hypothetical protein
MKSKYKFAFRRQRDEITFRQADYLGSHPLCIASQRVEEKGGRNIIPLI